jgi:hypothetical protein
MHIFSMHVWAAGCMQGCIEPLVMRAGLGSQAWSGVGLTDRPKVVHPEIMIASPRIAQKGMYCKCTVQLRAQTQESYSVPAPMSTRQEPCIV